MLSDSGLASQTTVTLFADTSNQGYDGFKIASFTPTGDSGTQSVTWNLTDLPYATYYVYAAVEDEVNETTVFSLRHPDGHSLGAHQRQRDG